MLAQVIFTPNSVQERGGTRYTDIKVELRDGTQVNCYAQETNEALWEAIHSVEKGQIIDVVEFERDGKTYYRPSDEEVERLLNGQKHVANYGDDADPEAHLRELIRLYQLAEELMGTETTPSEDTVQRLVVTSFIQSMD